MDSMLLPWVILGWLLVFLEKRNARNWRALALDTQEIMRLSMLQTQAYVTKVNQQLIAMTVAYEQRLDQEGESWKSGPPEEED